MSYDPRQWSFVADMNYNGLVTISDVWLWFKWLYFYPGDLFIYLSVNSFPSFASFFEISYNDYSGFLSGVVSFVLYSIAISFTISSIISLIDDEE